MFAEDEHIRNLAPHYFGRCYVQYTAPNYTGDTWLSREGADGLPS